MNTQNKPSIIIGITGGIAAYKIPYLIRGLKSLNWQVQVVITEMAKQFVTPLTIQAINGQPPITDYTDHHNGMDHIRLAKMADYLIIAPASANIIAKLAHGQADNLLTTMCLAAKTKPILCPAMNQQMWQNSIVQTNIAQLITHGMQIWGPNDGAQACGDYGPGRMLEPEQILAKLQQTVTNQQILTGKRLLITAGATRESIDPVRYLTNHSSGKMGYAIATAAQQSGAQVTLLSANVNLADIPGIKIIKVTDTAQMQAAIQQQLTQGVDIFIGAAAIADYRPAKVNNHKIKKDKSVDSNQILTLDLVVNPDLLSYVANYSPRPFVVGFCAETENLLANAKTKLIQKKADLIIANQINLPGIGFNSDYNKITIVSADQVETWQQDLKINLANQLIKRIAELTKQSLNRGESIC